MKKIYIWICLPLLCGCGNRAESGAFDGHQFTVEGETVTVAEGSPVLQNIKIEAVEAGTYSAAFTTSCAVEVIPSAYAEIASPFAGRILRSNVELGQTVSIGTTVFELVSPEYTEAMKAYFHSKSEMEQAEKNVNRAHDLHANGVGTARDLEEAETNHDMRLKDYEQAKMMLAVFPTNLKGATISQTLAVTSPVAGEVVRSNIVIGKYIRADEEAPVVVANLDRVWVKAHVREKDIPLTARITGMEIRLSALPDTVFAGRIRYTGSMLDEETRTVEIIVECENARHVMKPNMYGTVRFVNAPAPAFIVPEAAVLQDADERYVMVSEGGNRFRKTPVVFDRTMVVSGLRSGERIVTEGAFYFIDAR
jgi:cobalt-zinc-cadmium efflux system membrane fusion protein